MRVWFCDTMEKQNSLWCVGASGRCMDRPVRRDKAVLSGSGHQLLSLSSLLLSLSMLSSCAWPRSRHTDTIQTLKDKQVHYKTSVSCGDQLSLSHIHFVLSAFDHYPAVHRENTNVMEMTILPHSYTTVSHLFDKKSITWRRRTILSCWAAQTTVTNAPGDDKHDTFKGEWICRERWPYTPGISVNHGCSLVATIHPEQSGRNSVYLK